MASLLDYLQNPSLAQQPQQVEMVQTQLPGYTPPQAMQMQQPQQQQQQGVDPMEAYKLGKNLQGAFGGTPTATAASMPPVGILNPAAYSSAMNAGPAMQMAGLDMGGLTAGLPGMGGASGAAGTAGAGGAAGAGAFALPALAAVAGDKAFYGNGFLGEKNLDSKKLLGKMDAGDFARAVNPSSYLKDPKKVAKSVLDIFTLGML